MVPSRKRYYEGALVGVITAAVTLYVFSNNPPLGIAHQALLYVIFPFIIWSVLQQGQRGAAAATLIISGHPGNKNAPLNGDGLLPVRGASFFLRSNYSLIHSTLTSASGFIPG